MDIDRRRACLTLAAGSGLLAGLGACERRLPLLRIGVAMPLSGPLAEEGRSVLFAAGLAAQHIGQHGSGLGGKPVSIAIVSADDRGEDGEAPAAAARLVAQGVEAVIGHLTSGGSLAAAPIYAAAGVAQLCPATHPRLTQLGLRTIFRLVANDQVQAQALARHAAAMKAGQLYAVVDDGSVYGRGLAENVAGLLLSGSQQVAFRRTYPPTETAFDDLVAAIGTKPGPSVVVTTMEPPQVQGLLKALQRAGHTGVARHGPDPLKNPPLPPPAAAVRASLATTPIPDERDFGRPGGEFRRLYMERHSQPPADAALYAHDAVHLLAQAAAGERGGGASAIVAALRSIDPVLPITGSMRFDAAGELSFGVINLYTADRGHWRLVTRGAVW